MMGSWGSRAVLAGIAGLICLAGCAKPEPPPNLLAPTEAQLKTRSLQSRDFDVSDRSVAIRAVVEALQDLGFIIERANADMGLVTAARFAEPRYSDVVGVTVTVRPVSGDKMTVRINAIYNNKPVTDPEPYQNFFATLERSLFIERN